MEILNEVIEKLSILVKIIITIVLILTMSIPTTMILTMSIPLCRYRCVGFDVKILHCPYSNINNHPEFLLSTSGCQNSKVTIVQNILHYYHTNFWFSTSTHQKSEVSIYIITVAMIISTFNSQCRCVKS